MQTCYYHQSPLAYFCTHPKCTLPLCHKCLSIHQKETQAQPSHDINRHLLSFDQAKKRAIGWIRSNIQDKRQALTLLDKNLSELRQRIIKVLDQELRIRQKEIDELVRLSEDITISLSAEEEIQTGSIKALIQAYDHYGWIDKNRQSTMALHKVQSLKLDFDFPSIKESLQIRLPDLPLSKGSEPANISVALAKQPHKSPRVKKGIRTSASLESNRQGTEHSEVFAYSTGLPRNTDSWKNVVNTKDMNIASPRLNKK